MKHVLSCAAAMAIVLSAVLPLRAADPPAEMKTVIAASLAGYDELYRDIEFLGQASGNPDLARGVEGLVSIVTQLQGLAGLDKARPLGAAVRTDGIQFQILAFVPIKNIKQLFSALSGLVGVPEKMGDHGWRINTRAGTAYIKEQGGWAFIAQLEDHLLDLPADPQALLEDMPKQYDLAVRINFQAVPAPMRDMLLDQLQQQLLAAEADANRQGAALAGELLVGNKQQVSELLSQLDQLTLGWSLDGASRRALLDFSVTGISGSKLAAMAEGPALPPSKLAGVMLGDEALSVHLHRLLPSGAIERHLTITNSLAKRLQREIKENAGLGDDDQAQVDKWIEQINAAVADTIRKGFINGGLVVFDGSPLTLAAGMVVEHTDQLESIFRQGLKLAEQADPAPRVQLDMHKLDDVRFHQITMPTDDLVTLADTNDPEFAELAKHTLGEQAHLTVAFGPQRVFFALGPMGVGTIQKVIENSPATSRDADDARLRIRLALGPIFEWKINSNTNPIWAQVADEVARSGKDHVTFSARPIPGGVRLRLEGEEGVVKTLGVALKLMAIGGPVGF